MSEVTFVCPTPAGEATDQLEGLRPFYTRAVTFPRESLFYRRNLERGRIRRMFGAVRAHFTTRDPFLISWTRSTIGAEVVGRLCREERFDLVWIERIISLSLLPRAIEARIIVDIDDIEHRRLAYRLRAGVLPWRHLPLEVVEVLKLRRFERRLAAGPYELLVCSAVDRSALGGGRRIHVVPNGVDIPKPALRLSGGSDPVFLFVGSMNLLPNVDAVGFFATRVFPLVRQRLPAGRFVVVGHEPPPSIRRLHDGCSITVTGSVPDVVPYLRQATAAVVPIRFGGGTRLKILEAMAHRVPVVSTTVGAEGLEVEPGRHLLVADRPRAFADACATLAAEPLKGQALTSAAFELVMEKYEWGKIERDIQTIASDRAAVPKSGRAFTGTS